MVSVIREAAQEDYPALCDITEEVDRLHREALPWRFKAPGGPARPLDYILSAIAAPDVAIFLADSEGQPAGFVHVIVKDVPDIPILVPRRYALVENLVVRGAHRRRGIGRALMEKAEAWARNRGATSLELSVYAFNQTAQDFYRALGYETVTHYLRKPL